MSASRPHYRNGHVYDPRDRDTHHGTRGAAFAARLRGSYELALHLPLSTFAREVRRTRRALLGRKPKGPTPTRLPSVRWSRILPAGRTLVVEPRKANGNVRTTELAVLARAAAAVTPGSEVVEIGTFDGRTTLNLAVNAPPSSPVLTLDLPVDHPTRFGIEATERAFVEKPLPGLRFRSCEAPWREPAGRIVQLLGDSACFDWSAHFGRAGLVFVDGSHTYDYARQDSETALRLVAPRGRIVWHDYGSWGGVTRALEDLEDERQLGLVRIWGTSLVTWLAP